METIDYQDILEATARAADLDPDDLSATEFAALRTQHSLRLRAAWQNQMWPFLKKLGEKRWFRDAYASGTSYAATTEVSYEGPQKYYQALRTALNQAPATYSSGTWTTNLAYWAESSGSYTANEYSATKAYTQGQQVFYSPTQRYYQLYVASSTGNLPTDTTKWGVLTEFRRYVAYAQTGKTTFNQVFNCWDKDPGLSGAARRSATQYSSELGLHVLDNVPFVFLDYRKRPVQLTGDAWDQTTAYTVGRQVYYQTTSTRGNFYDCAVTTTAGQSPATTPASWTVVDIPGPFSLYLVHGAAADYLKADEPARAGAEESRAKKALEDETLVWLGQMLTTPQNNVRGR